MKQSSKIVSKEFQRFKGFQITRVWNIQMFIGLSEIIQIRTIWNKLEQHETKFQDGFTRVSNGFNGYKYSVEQHETIWNNLEQYGTIWNNMKQSS